MKFDFLLSACLERARAGILRFTDGTTIETPAFMPVGTQATVKAINQSILEDIGYRLILANTYHLYLRPGTDVLSRFEGLQQFMSWPYRILTDSGGYQAFSLSHLIEYQDNGIIFRSHLDGSKHLFSPENVLSIQKIIRSDIIMPIDDCPPHDVSQERIELSLLRTHAWFEKSYAYFKKHHLDQEQSLFALVQGGLFPDMRRKSCQYLSQFDPDGFAIGGFSVGEKNDLMINILGKTTQYLAQDKPRYLMGVGSIPEIIHAVECGIDLFDCVLPTRNARNGQLLTWQGKINIRNAIYASQHEPIDPGCSCSVCKKYSRGYLRHLYKSNEILGMELGTHHNLHFMFHFMKKMRLAICNHTLDVFKNQYVNLFRKS